MRLIRSSCALALASVLALACASNVDDRPASQTAPATATKAPPANSKLARVQVGMTDEQVRQILGSPDNTNSYMTGKSWIPFYYGSDTSRADWMYRGLGRVVFSRNRYGGGLKVIRVDYDPKETAGQ